ncbi:ABC transporter ATP-binding protein [Homoserinibacter sp. GY 40078]|uniref:ABC transporter ATP-binding protein n=1 Tax=Homoserinibacter sp. GY 40078 TaxID=2603275 RepID=UPI0011C9850E|nr:ATP-binding cassette domain-containing protein [Homoserinibacter sp. GY 40078]TXK19002.1 ATP-binding cassette domain-containing protein [Homoserinibacter sp. GY 40078]
MLQIRGVGKSYGARRVLDDVSFDVLPGRMTGFVGGNGAGKTTTMRIILGVLEADEGSVTLDDAPLGPTGRRRFGYMPEERGLYPKMKLAEQLVYLARLHGLTADDARRSTDDLLGRLGLAERAGDAVEKLSLGNQQRAQIAAALVHKPEVLILDEPFSGLDPMAVEVVLEVLLERARAGAPVLFSSHQLDIVERLCDDLVIISEGTIRAAGPREELRDEHSSLRYQLQTSADAGWLRQEAGIDVIETDGGFALFDAETPEAASRVLRAAVERGEVTDFSRQHPTLSQIFKEVVR